jgi:hypothetical protein
MIVLLAALVSAGAATGLWALFLMYCALNASLKSGKLKQTPPPVRAMSYTLLGVMWVADLVFNVTVGSLVFLELPKTLMFTSRCSSHLKDEGWRGDLARWVCDGWLNPFEAGHCR